MKIELTKIEVANCIYLIQQERFKEVGRTKRYDQLGKLASKFEKVYFSNKK